MRAKADRPHPPSTCVLFILLLLSLIALGLLLSKGEILRFGLVQLLSKGELLSITDLVQHDSAGSLAALSVRQHTRLCPKQTAFSTSLLSALHTVASLLSGAMSARIWARLESGLLRRNSMIAVSEGIMKRSVQRLRG